MAIDGEDREHLIRRAACHALKAALGRYQEAADDDAESDGEYVATRTDAKNLRWLIELHCLHDANCLTEKERLVAQILCLSALTEVLILGRGINAPLRSAIEKLERKEGGGDGK